jgi:hypothetical protein
MVYIKITTDKMITWYEFELLETIPNFQSTIRQFTMCVAF